MRLGLNGYYYCYGKDVKKGILRKTQAGNYFIEESFCSTESNKLTVFETHLNGTQEYQSSVLRDKYKYIGKSVFLEYGERSGVNQVPFHIKGVTILK